ncbi:MAG: hypothetical protein SW833_03290 [Cyanobacteriota bacterium]|nr:hypothetical protein [Cyanobacteriota bacterium]
MEEFINLRDRRGMTQSWWQWHPTAVCVRGRKCYIKQAIARYSNLDKIAQIYF